MKPKKIAIGGGSSSEVGQKERAAIGGQPAAKQTVEAEAERANA